MVDCNRAKYPTTAPKQLPSIQTHLFPKTHATAAAQSSAPCHASPASPDRRPATEVGGRGGGSALGKEV